MYGIPKLKYNRIHDVPLNGFLQRVSNRLMKRNAKRYWKLALKETNDYIANIHWISGVEKDDDPELPLLNKNLMKRRMLLITLINGC